jgi:hypothetical protein
MEDLLEAKLLCITPCRSKCSSFSSDFFSWPSFSIFFYDWNIEFICIKMLGVPYEFIFKLSKFCDLMMSTYCPFPGVVNSYFFKVFEDFSYEVCYDYKAEDLNSGLSDVFYVPSAYPSIYDFMVSIFSREFKPGNPEWSLGDGFVF